MAERRDLVFRFVGDARSLQRANRQAQTGFTRTQRTSRSMSASLTTAAAKFTLVGAGVTGAYHAVESFIGASRDLQESQNAVNVVYGDAAAEIAAFAETASDRLGLSKRAFNELVVAQAGFAEQIAEGTGKTVPEVIDRMTRRVADFASVMNLSAEEAGRTWQSIMAGSSEVARRYGIDVSAASVEQYILAEGIAATKSAITESDKVLGRYMLLMDETDRVQGDFAATADDAANAQRRATAAWEDARAELGEAVLPAVAAVTSAAADYARTAADAADSSRTWAERLSSAADIADTLWRTVTPTSHAVKWLADLLGDEAPPDIDRTTVAVAALADQVHRLRGEVDQYVPPTSWGSDFIADSRAGTVPDAAARRAGAVRAAQVARLDDLEIQSANRGPPIHRRHTGGTVPGPTGQPTMVRALGGEEVVHPGHDSGRGVNIVIQAGVGDPQEIARQVIDALQVYGRTSGQIPVTAASAAWA